VAVGRGDGDGSKDVVAPGQGEEVLDGIDPRDERAWSVVHEGELGPGRGGDPGDGGEHERCAEIPHRWTPVVEAGRPRYRGGGPRRWRRAARRAGRAGRTTRT